MRTALLLLAFSISANAVTLYNLNGDHAYFSLLGTNILNLQGNSTVASNVGAVNLSNAQSTVNGEAHFSAGITCTLPCGNITGGFVTNSAQYLASVNAWSNLISQVQALQATGTISAFGGGQTLTSGVWDVNSFVLFNSETLTLDAQGDPNAQFVLRSGIASLSNQSSINLINGASPANVLIVGSNMLIDTTTPQQGIFYSSGPLVRTGSSGAERLTLVGRNVNYSGQLTAPAAEVPEPSSLLSSLLGGIGLFAVRRLRSRN